MKHQQQLPKMLDSLIEESALPKSAITHCAFANGPGAFTGIRIAAARAQGIGLALSIPLLPFSTLKLLAQTAFDQSTYNYVLVALDARMNEIYWACYQRDEQGFARLDGAEQLTAAAEINVPDSVEAGFGHGWVEELRSRASFEVDASLFPDARSMLMPARAGLQQHPGIDASQIEINYLRNQVAHKAGR